jgi:isopentenyl-diphosphate delta-isomerase
MSEKIETRKSDHLVIAAKESVQRPALSTFDSVRFEPYAMPDLNMDEISCASDFLGYRLSLPIIISSMSGGIAQADRMNIHLAEAAETVGVALSLGSMRIALEDQGQAKSFQLRRYAPNIPIIGNLGAAQLRGPSGIDNALRCIDIAEADALYIHLNPMQEAIQPGGDRDWSGIVDALIELCARSTVPVLIKEVGHGIGPTTAKMLSEIGIEWLDVAGSGGTSWAQIEHDRTRQDESIFADWGIDTVTAVTKISALGLPLSLIASGGIRNGLHVAKCLRIGASLAGIAKPLLTPALTSTNHVIDTLRQFESELRTTMFCTNSASLGQLTQAPLLKDPTKN